MVHVDGPCAPQSWCGAWHLGPRPGGAGPGPCRRRRLLCLIAGATAVYVALRLTIQASAEFPENTLRSFAQAIKDGSEGIESGTSY